MNVADIENTPEQIYLNAVAAFCSEFRLDGLPEAGDLLYREIALANIYLPLELSPSAETKEALEKNNSSIWSPVLSEKGQMSPEQELEVINQRITRMEQQKEALERERLEAMEDDARELIALLDCELEKLKSPKEEGEAEELLELINRELNLCELRDIKPVTEENILGQPRDSRIYEIYSAVPQGDEPYKDALWQQYDNKPVGPVRFGEPSRRIILSGPGYGKTTMIKRIALAYAQNDETFLQEAGIPGQMFPLLLLCRTMNNAFADEFTEENDSIRFEQIIWKLTGSACELHINPEAFSDMIHTKAAEGKLLLLIDGFDEIFDLKKQLVFARRLSEFMAVWPKAHLVLTSRETTFEQRNTDAVEILCRIRAIRFNRILPLNRPMVETYCRKWFRVVFSKEPDVQQCAERIIGQLNKPQFQYLEQMTRVPLHLSNLLVVTRRSGLLPENKNKLYEQYMDLVLNWHSDGCYELRDILIQLSYVAHFMTKRGLLRLTRHMLTEVLKQCAQDLEGIYLPAEPGCFIDKLEERTCVLENCFHVSGQPVYQFTHLQLQEYLTAQAILFGCSDPEDNQLHPVDVLKKYFDQPAWREIIVMVALQGDNRVTPALLEELLACAENNPDDNYYVSNLLFEMIVNFVPMRMDTRRRIYDLLFRANITDYEIRRIGEFMRDSRSGDFVQYITEQHRQSYEMEDTDFAFADAVIRIFECIERKEHPLELAQEMFLNFNDIKRQEAVFMLTIISWCKYCGVKGALSLYYQFTFHPQFVAAVREALLEEEYGWKDLVSSVKDMLLAGLLSDQAVLDEAVFCKAFQVYCSDSPKFGKELLSMFPITYESLMYDVEVTEEIRDRAREAYEEADPVDKAFAFTICALCKCWDVWKRGITDELVTLEGYYSQNRNKMDDAARIKMSQLRRQVYALGDLLSQGIEAYQAGEIKKARDTFMKAWGNTGAMNNLAYMLRRGEIGSVAYKGIEYSVPELLKAGVEAGEGFSLVNMALYECTEKGDFSFAAARAYIGRIDPDEVKGIFYWWIHAALKKEREGFLVLSWLMETGFIDETPFGGRQEISRILEEYENGTERR
ncbi:NACHT domain-containing protein [Enterocloster asparagiformis]|uniref:NACHT domain-containing protein n=1 Tax=Enterocloster asparagiformis TaxID=333367 RepID=UPI002A807B93|nr:NACHT domain-containing protein [Enterocloster asparagiformis]